MNRRGCRRMRVFRSRLCRRLSLEDGKLQLTKFGVDFIRDEDIRQLKQHEDATSQVVNNLFQATLFLPIDLQWYLHACDANTKLHTCLSNIHDPVISIKNFILDYGSQQDSLEGIHKIMKYMFELSQQVFNEYKEEWRNSWLSPLVYEYYRICHGTSELYNDFVRLLRDISGSWVCVKLALEQNMAKIRAGGYTYIEMLQQLNDIETATSVRFSDNFLILFAYICQKTVAFIRNLNKQIQGFERLKLLKVMVKVSSITIAGSLTVVAKYMGDNELLQEMKDISRDSMWLHLIQSFSRKIRFIVDKGNRNANFEISDLYGNAHILKELKNKMAQFNFVTNENAKQVIIVIKKLAKNISNFLVTVDDIRSHAQKFSLDVREAGISLNPFIAGGNLRVTKFGVSFIHDKEIQQLKQDEDYATQVMKVLYGATSSLPEDLPWYLCACGADTGLHSCHSIICDYTRYQIKLFIAYGKHRHSLDGMRKIFECLYEVYQKTLTVESKSMADWKIFISVIFNFFLQLTGLLKDISDSWLSVKLALKQLFKNSRADSPTYEEMELQLNEADQRIRQYHDIFGISVADVCEETIHFMGQIKDTDMVKLMLVLVAGMLGVVAIYMGDSDLLEELSNTIPNSDRLLFLIRICLVVDGRWFDENGNLKELLQIWGHRIVEIENEMLLSNHVFTKEIENEMFTVVDTLQLKIDFFSNTIEHMYTDANKYFGLWHEIDF